MRDGIAECLGSARLWRAGERVLAIANFAVGSIALLMANLKESLFRRDAETSTRDACATQAGRLDCAIMLAFWRSHRRKRLRTRPFPNQWLTQIQRHVVFFHRLSGSD